MRLSEDIKPISYLKNNAAKVIKTITENKRPMVITQNGEAKAVVQDIESYDNNSLSGMISLLQSLKRSSDDFKNHQTVNNERVFAEIKAEFLDEV